MWGKNREAPWRFFTIPIIFKAIHKLFKVYFWSYWYIEHYISTLDENTLVIDGIKFVKNNEIKSSDFYDNNGNFYKYPRLEFAGKSTTSNVIGCNLPQDVPMQGTLTISNFDTSATKFNARFYIYIYNNSVQLRDKNLYFKNVPIY